MRSLGQSYISDQVFQIIKNTFFFFQRYYHKPFFSGDNALKSLMKAILINKTLFPQSLPDSSWPCNFWHRPGAAGFLGHLDTLVHVNQHAQVPSWWAAFQPHSPSLCYCAVVTQLWWEALSLVEWSSIGVLTNLMWCLPLSSVPLASGSLTYALEAN